MTNVSIRPFAWGDTPAIAAIYRHYVENSTATFDIEPPGETFWADKLGHMVELGHPVLVAEDGGEARGYAYATFYRPRPAYRFTAENTVYCGSDAVGRGVGTALMERLIADARAAGFRQMIAVITAESEASLRLHEKLGFRIVGRYEAVGFKFERWLDVVHMQKGLV